MPSDDVARRIAALAVAWHEADAKAYDRQSDAALDPDWLSAQETADAARIALFDAIAALPAEVRGNLRRG